MYKVPKEHLTRAHLLMGEFGSFERGSKQELFIDELCDSISKVSNFWYHADICRSRRNRMIYLNLICTFGILVTSIFTHRYLFPTAILPFALSSFYLSHLAFKRAENFESDYPPFLLSLASSVRAGLDPLSAMLESEKLFELGSEIGKELSKFKLGIEQGKPEQDVIREFGASIKHPDIHLFRAGYLLARKEGSSFAECLQRLSKVTRQRQSFRRKIKSAVAMQRLSAFGIGACAVFIGIIQLLGNPKIMTDALAHPIGQKLLIAGGVLICGGLLWMTRMTKSRI